MERNQHNPPQAERVPLAEEYCQPPPLVNFLDKTPSPPKSNKMKWKLCGVSITTIIMIILIIARASVRTVQRTTIPINMNYYPKQIYNPLTGNAELRELQAILKTACEIMDQKLLNFYSDHHRIPTDAELEELASQLENGEIAKQLLSDEYSRQNQIYNSPNSNEELREQQAKNKRDCEKMDQEIQNFYYEHHRIPNEVEIDKIAKLIDSKKDSG